MATDDLGEYRERELKFEAPAEWTLPDPSEALSDDVVVERQNLTLTSTYYDTPARDLFDSGVTLRHREGERDAGWQLKVPDGDARVEISDPSTSSRVPNSLATVTMGLRGGAVLKPLATLRTQRAVNRVVENGTTLAEIVVDEVSSSVAGEPAASQQWREIEIELIDGDEDVLQQLATWLQKSGATPATSSSKLASALGAARWPRDTTTMGGLIASYLDQQVEALVRGDIALRRGTDAIHATRVATRRYRSALRVFGKLFDIDRAAELDAELAWYAAALGEVRDRHVLREHLAESLNKLPADLIVGPVATTINNALDAELKQAQADLAKVMRTARYFALIRHARTFRDELPGLADQPAVAAARYVKKAERAVARRLDHVPDRSHYGEAFHRVRKAAKRARYAAEIAEPAMGKAAAKIAKHAHSTQRELGNQQDAVLAAQFLLRLGAIGDGFTLGVLYERERARLQM